MKANINLSLNGYEEALALSTLSAELDDDGCNVEEEPTFNEDAYLDDVREGAGYESEEAIF
jgi:hypothetical protein